MSCVNAQLTGKAACRDGDESETTGEKERLRQVREEEKEGERTAEEE